MSTLALRVTEITSFTWLRRMSDSSAPSAQLYVLPQTMLSMHDRGCRARQRFIAVTFVKFREE